MWPSIERRMEATGPRRPGERDAPTGSGFPPAGLTSFTTVAHTGRPRSSATGDGGRGTHERTWAGAPRRGDGHRRHGYATATGDRCPVRGRPHRGRRRRRIRERPTRCGDHRRLELHGDARSHRCPLPHHLRRAGEQRRALLPPTPVDGDAHGGLQRAQAAPGRGHRLPRRRLPLRPRARATRRHRGRPRRRTPHDLGAQRAAHHRRRHRGAPHPRRREGRLRPRHDRPGRDGPHHPSTGQVRRGLDQDPRHRLAARTRRASSPCGPSTS